MLEKFFKDLSCKIRPHTENIQVLELLRYKINLRLSYSVFSSSLRFDAFLNKSKFNLIDINKILRQAQTRRGKGHSIGHSNGQLYNIVYIDFSFNISFLILYNLSINILNLIAILRCLFCNTELEKTKDN